MLRFPSFRSSDRRAHQRTPANDRCKVFEPRSGRYYTATTCDAADGGVMVRLDHPIEVHPGDSLLVGLTTPRGGLIRRVEMTKARVVRTLPITSGELAVALRFEPQEEGRRAA